MSEWPTRLEIARWEFRRFVKPNQLVVSFVIMLIMGGVGYGVAKLAKRTQGNDATIAVINGESLGITAAAKSGRLSLVPARADSLNSLKGQVQSRELDAVLILSGVDSARLIVKRNPSWLRDLEGYLTGARQGLQLRQKGIAPDELRRMLGPVVITSEYESGNDGRGARIAAFLAVGLVLYGVFSSMAYMLVSVTAEKQLRVAEQIVSAISPQTWIDGKILGIAAVALVNVLIFFGGAAVWILGRSIARSSPFTLGTAEPLAIVWIILFAMLGFTFWLAVFGAVAATIDDPNSSTRGPLMFLPAFFSVTGMLIPINPDSMFSRITGLIPLTSPAVMPARVALSDVPVWELMLSALVLVAATLVARRVAGKVFSVAMLMYGKEPSWSEVRRWARDG
jgi:ABC-2 type transport system permease protein